jgi:hypothetical protein
MSSIIDPKNDKVWKTYLQYRDLLGGTKSDVRGTGVVAAVLTQAHYADHVVCEAKVIADTVSRLIHRI